MKIRHRINGGSAEVSDQYGEALIASGSWELAEAPKKAAPTQPRRRATKAAQKTVQVDNEE